MRKKQPIDYFVIASARLLNLSPLLSLRAQRGNLKWYDEAKTSTSQYYCHCERSVAI